MFDFMCIVLVLISVLSYIFWSLPTLCFYFKLRHYIKKNEPALYDQIMKG